MNIAYAALASSSLLPAGSPPAFDAAVAAPDWWYNQLHNMNPYLQSASNQSAINYQYGPIPVNSAAGIANIQPYNSQLLDNIIAGMTANGGLGISVTSTIGSQYISLIIDPFLNTYSPNNMVQFVWLNYGTQTGFDSVDKLKNAVNNSTDFAGFVADRYGWGWSEACTIGCDGQQFIPASRYWTSSVLAYSLENAGASEVGNRVTGLIQSGYSAGEVWQAIVRATAQSAFTTTGGIAGLSGQGGYAGLDPTIYGSNPYIGGQILTPEFIITSDGSFLYNGGGLTTFTGVTAQQQQAWAQQGCGTTTDCGNIPNFWGATYKNGGWGQVQGGTIDSIHVPSSVVDETGQLAISANGQSAYVDNQGNPLSSTTVGHNIWVSYDLFTKVVVLGYNVADLPTSNAACAHGCVSVAGWNAALDNLPFIQQAVSKYAQETGLPIEFGQAPYEIGMPPEFGMAKRPSPEDALMSDLASGQVTKQMILDEQAACQCSYSEALNDFKQASYTTHTLEWMTNYGWTEALPQPGTVLGTSGYIFQLDPSCKSRLCIGGNTHYLVSNDYEFLKALFESPSCTANCKAAFSKFGINTVADIEKFLTTNVIGKADYIASTVGSPEWERMLEGYNSMNAANRIYTLEENLWRKTTSWNGPAYGVGGLHQSVSATLDQLYGSCDQACFDRWAYGSGTLPTRIVNPDGSITYTAGVCGSGGAYCDGDPTGEWMVINGLTPYVSGPRASWQLTTKLLNLIHATCAASSKCDVAKIIQGFADANGITTKVDPPSDKGPKPTSASVTTTDHVGTPGAGGCISLIAFCVTASDLQTSVDHVGTSGAGGRISLIDLGNGVATIHSVNVQGNSVLGPLSFLNTVGAVLPAINIFGLVIIGFVWILVLIAAAILLIPRFNRVIF